MQITNNTSGCPAELNVWTAPDGRDHVVAVVKATFDITPGGQVRPAEDPAPLIMTDVHHGDPATTSVRLECDFAPRKPAAEVLVIGNVHAPGGRQSTEVLAELRLGPLAKQVLAVGDRYWTAGAFGAVPSSPQRFERLPLLYELAFGGAEVGPDGVQYEVSRQNPLGKGLFQHSDVALGEPVPNLEYPSDRLHTSSSRPAPASFGVVGRSWLPRLSYAGTYDQQWVDSTYPFLPRDFSDRYFQSAPEDQQLPSLRPGETCSCLNLTESGLLTFQLPDWTHPVRFRFHGRDVDSTIVADTLIVEPDVRRFMLIGRAMVPLGRKLSDLQEVLIGVRRPAPSEDDSDKSHFASLSEFIAWKQGGDDFEGDP